LLNWVVYLTLILLAGIAFDVWSDWMERALAIGATAAMGVLYWRVAHRAYSQRGLYVYFALQAALAFGLLAFAFPRDPHYILLIILCIQAMLILPVRPALAWVALFYLASAVGESMRQGLGAIVESIYNVAAFALTGAFGYTVRQAELARRRNEQLLEELRAAQRQVQELAVVEERNRLARDLHDSVKQQVFAIGMQLGAARASLDEQAEAFAHVVEAERLARQAGQELTTLIRQLRPAALERKTLAATLQQLAGEWSRQSNIPVQVRLEGAAALARPAEEALLRVAQEALANAARHSGATAVEISLVGEAAAGDGPPARSASLTIADNGRGFDRSTVAKGVGLDSMRERLEALGGRLTVESEPGKGTRVIGRLEANSD
jgi:signal transduction histidine kinase